MKITNKASERFYILDEAIEIVKEIVKKDTVPSNVEMKKFKELVKLILAEYARVFRMWILIKETRKKDSFICNADAEKVTKKEIKKAESVMKKNFRTIYKLQNNLIKAPKKYKMIDSKEKE